MKHGKPRSLVPAAVLMSALTVAGADAKALPKEGDAAPNARLEDVDGRVVELKQFKGKPILIVYEDKESAEQNSELKKELSKLAKGERYKSTMAIAAIADVSAYDFWPAKGFVKDAIREESRKQGTTIYCDWNGAFRTRYKMRQGVSNVVLVAKNGHIAFASEGKLSQEKRKRLIELLRVEVEGK